MEHESFESEETAAIMNASRATGSSSDKPQLPLHTNFPVQRVQCLQRLGMPKPVLPQLPRVLPVAKVLTRLSSLPLFPVLCSCAVGSATWTGLLTLLLQAYFINIKVDREERPDVDRVYVSLLPCWCHTADGDVHNCMHVLVRVRLRVWVCFWARGPLGHISRCRAFIAAARSGKPSKVCTPKC